MAIQNGLRQISGRNVEAQSLPYAFKRVQSQGSLWLPNLPLKTSGYLSRSIPAQLCVMKDDDCALLN